MTIDADTTESTKLENKIILMSLINIISFIVTLKQLYVDTSWNMKVRVRDPDLILSCSSFESNSRCCKKNIKASVTKMYENNQVNERYVLCFIVICGMSAFALLFIIGGFCVGYRSKHRNVIMHPIFSVGMFTHLTNCFFFTIGLLMRQARESEICRPRQETSKLDPNDQYAIKCLKRVLSCEDMDANFKYWFVFSVGCILVGIAVLLYSYRYSRSYYTSFCQMFSCSNSRTHSSLCHSRSNHNRQMMTAVYPMSSVSNDHFTAQIE